MKVYAVRPGSIAARVLEHVKANGATATSPLAEALDIDATAIAPSCMAAVQHGLIAKERRGGLNWYSVGDGKRQGYAREAPLQVSDRPRAPLTDGVDIDKYLHRSTSAEEDGEPVPPTSVSVMRAAAAPPLDMENEHAAFSCALWSDGRLALELDGQRVLTLGVEQTRELLRYLDRLTPEVAT